MTFPTLTPPPTTPDRNDPVTFNARADAFVAWWTTNNTEMAAWTILANALSGTTGTFQFTDGSAATPAVTFAADPDIGMWRPGTNLLAFSTAGLEAFRITSAQSLIMGSSLAMTGIGGSRITSQGATAATGQWALGQFNAASSGPTLAFGKSRGAAVDTYTIVTAGDTLGNVEAWGSDGATMVLGAKLDFYNIGTPAAGDVRGGLRIRTGSGAGVVAIRLTIDDTTVAATLPITSTGAITAGSVLTGGFVGHGSGTLALAFATKDNCSVSPNATGTFTTTVPPAGTKGTLIINTTGTTSYTMTFGTGFKSQGTLATGIVNGKVFTVSFISDGAFMIETSRTVAM